MTCSIDTYCIRNKGFSSNIISVSHFQLYGLGTARTEQTSEKSSKKLAQRGSIDSIYKIFCVFFYSVIFIHKLDIMRKK